MCNIALVAALAVGAEGHERERSGGLLGGRSAKGTEVAHILRP